VRIPRRNQWWKVGIAGAIIGGAGTFMIFQA
jgi:hypothetical protein